MSNGERRSWKEAALRRCQWRRDYNLPKRRSLGPNVTPTPAAGGWPTLPPRPPVSTPPSVFARTRSGGSPPASSDRRPDQRQSPTGAGSCKASSPVSAPASNSTGTAWTAPDGHLLGVPSHRSTHHSALPPFTLRQRAAMIMARTCNQFRANAGGPPPSLRCPLCTLVASRTMSCRPERRLRARRRQTSWPGSVVVLWRTSNPAATEARGLCSSRLLWYK